MAEPDPTEGKINELWSSIGEQGNRISDIEASIARLETSVENVVNLVGDLSGSMRRIADRQTESNKPDWNVLIAATTLVFLVTVGILGFSQFTRTQDMHSISQHFESVEAEQEQHRDQMLRLSDHGLVTFEAAIRASERLKALERKQLSVFLQN